METYHSILSNFINPNKVIDSILYRKTTIHNLFSDKLQFTIPNLFCEVNVVKNLNPNLHYIVVLKSQKVGLPICVLLV